MKIPITIILLLAGFTLSKKGQQNPLKYPDARRVNQTDTYFGVKVEDPYRWMENVNTEEVKNWVNQEEELLNEYLEDNIQQQAIAGRMKEISQIGKTYSAPRKRGEYYYYQFSTPEQKFPVIARRTNLEDNDEEILNLNEILTGNLTFGGFSESNDGRYLVIRKRQGQSVWGDLYLYDVDQKKFLDDIITGVNSPASFWDKSNSGFYYVTYGDTEKLQNNQMTIRAEVRFHKVGTNEEDKLIFSNPDEETWAYGLNISRGSNYLIISVFEGGSSTNRVYYKNLQRADSEIIRLITTNNFAYTFLGDKGDNFWFYTNENAPEGKIISININNPSKDQWQTVVGESDEVIQGGSTAGGNAMTLVDEHIVLLYRNGPISNIKMFNLSGKLEQKIDLHTGWIGSGLVSAMSEPEVFFTLNTFSQPSTVYRLDLNNGDMTKFNQVELPVNPEEYLSKYVYYQSKDGTRIPMFIAYKKGTPLNGHSPLYMYAYGFAGWVAVPWYQPNMLTWLDMGGIYAMPGIRGGGEYGEDWEKAGVLLNRQNAIDDYIAATQYLINEKYTSAELMVANGWSASGSLAAAAVMQRPDLFGAAMIGIPSLDLLRYQHFTPFKGWTSGYGSSDNENEFNVLYSYSPYHNINRNTCYPPILITVGEKDQVVPPQHAYKFVARMQYNQPCSNPVLMKIVRGGGHGFGTSPEQIREVQSQELAFLVKVLNLEQSKALIKNWK